MKVLITGSNGFVGSALRSVLTQSGHEVIRVVRASTTPWDIPVGDLDGRTDWQGVLGSGVDAVVHLAAKVPPSVPLPDIHCGVAGDLHHLTNTDGTANLALQCAQNAVKRFIFVSTVKVLGEGKDEPYRDTDLAAPSDAYAISKWDAEQTLWRIASETGIEVVVLRPPRVYGPGVKGNFLRLMQAIDERRPLPFGRIHNRLSFIYVGNLADVIHLCITCPEAAGKNFLVSDGDDVSTPELVRRIAAALCRQPFLVPVPLPWIRLYGRILHEQAVVNRLLGSLIVDMSPLRVELDWKPPYTMQAGLEATAQWYRKIGAAA